MKELDSINRILRYRAEFNEKEHIYKVGDKFLPSVTEILKGLGFIETKWYKPQDSIRGKSIHVATELFDKGVLDWEKLPDYIKPHVDNWIKFKEDTDFKPLFLEEHLYHPYYMYGFTPDKIGTIKDDYTIIDIKTGAYQRWHELQLMLYGTAVETMIAEPVTLYDVYTKNNKSEKIKYDAEIIEAILTVWKWQHE